MHQRGRILTFREERQFDSESQEALGVGINSSIDFLKLRMWVKRSRVSVNLRHEAIAGFVDHRVADSVLASQPVAESESLIVGRIGT